MSRGAHALRSGGGQHRETERPSVGNAAPNRASPSMTSSRARSGFLDQTALWGNLGISLLGPVTAVFVVAPGMSFLAAFIAVVVGTVIGAAGLALANVAGARTGKPAMVMLRGLFGAKLSYLPTVLNLVQLLGWATFEILVISQAAEQLLPWHVQWPYKVVAGALTTVMAIWPLGSVRLLRRYALVAVLIAIGVPDRAAVPNRCPSLTHGGWNGFWTGTDLVIAVSVSWVPLAADYSRHSRTRTRRVRPDRSSATASPRSSATAWACSPSPRWRAPTRRSTACSARSSRCRWLAGVRRCWCCASWTSPSPTSTPPRSRCRTCGRSPIGGCSRSRSARWPRSGRSRFDIASYQNFLT